MVSENKILSRMIGHKRQEVREGWSKVGDELRNLYFSLI